MALAPLHLIPYPSPYPVNFTLYLALSTALLTELSLICHLNLFGVALGYASTTIEVTLSFPQIYNNCRARSVEGLSRTMVVIWTMSDITKTVYFYI